eukprot:CAMPEP_0172557606 /NCGR_PEP_ID=MMETSP1067-20121228/74203_1 /TAXON_ID=265564 ORGANISM="Thalassiosira punctigera, Strain Tpunct2005C2" /NCGR_SAMPLE_ID=MMETSP1067 /ASSEMBLY_ACC=CAM_ASM_000444 /LENGTH=178 /DNA_ID=CAMNT_0013346741 /DNA_START=9 /DNA_END=541 /DNA_ORIENTATION=+
MANNWLGIPENELLTPIVLPESASSDDHDSVADYPAAADDAFARMDPRLAAAARAIASTPARRGSDAAKRRRSKLEKIKDRMRRVSRRVGDVSAASEEIAAQMESLGHYDSDTPSVYARRISDGSAEGGDVARDKKMSNVVAMKAAIVLLMATAGIAAYLATFWNSLSTIVHCFVVGT